LAAAHNHLFLIDLTQSRNVAVRRRSAPLAAGGLLARHFCRDPAAVWRTPVKGGSSPAAYWRSLTPSASPA